MKKEPSERSQKTPKSERTAKQLLGELYTDKEYLEKLLKDEGVFMYSSFAYVQKSSSWCQHQSMLVLQGEPV